MKKVFILLFSICNVSVYQQDVWADSLNKDYKYKLSVASIFKNESFFMKEWIEFHRLAGVEHFWLYNNSSTDNSLEILAPYIKKGIVEVFDWPTKTSMGSWTVDPVFMDEFKVRLNFAITQRDAYLDALKRSSGKSKWLAIIDLDEFLVPLSDETITACLEKNYDLAAAVYVNWLNFGTSNVTLKNEESILFNLTNCSPQNSSINKLGKSIVRPEYIVRKTILFPFLLIHYFTLNGKTRHYYNGNAGIINGNQAWDGKFNSQTHNEFSKGIFTNFLRLNHYKMGDDKYFSERRLEKQKVNASNINADLMIQNRFFNKEKNDSIISYIKNKHPEQYQKNWKDGLFKRM